MQNTQMLLTILAAAIGALVLIQAVVMFAMLVVMRKSLSAASVYAEEMKSKVIPVLDESREMMEATKHLVARLEPKLDAAASDLAEITRTANEEAKRLQISAEEISERVRRQAARIDGLTTTTLDGVDRAGRLLNSAVAAPVRQVTGMMAAAKAVLDVLRRPAPARHAERP